MKVDLQSAKARPTGDSGIAHRTAAGFVAIGTADAQSLLPILEEHHRDASLVERVVEQLVAEPPDGFAMLFSSDGDVFALMVGTARLTISAPTASQHLSASSSQVAVVPVRLPLNDPTGTITMAHSETEAGQPVGLSSLVDLHAGTVLADSVELSVRAVSEVSSPVDDGSAAQHPQPVVTLEDLETDAVDVPEPSVFDDDAISADVPAVSEATPAVNDGQPVADEIVFAEDLDPAVDEVALDEPIAVEAEPTQATPGFIPGAGVLGVTAGAFGSFVDSAAADRRRAENNIDEYMSDNDIGHLASDATEAVPGIDELPTPPAPVPDTGTDEWSANNAISDSVPAVPPDLPAPPEVLPPPVPATAAPQASGIGPVMVLGVACPNGHHNHPDAVYCSQCGTKMGVHNTTVLLNGPRPPLGVLVVDDGMTWSLTSDLVVGREPSGHPGVVAGTAEGMVLGDDTLAMSRQHAHISLDDWSVYVIDLQSSNGTFINRDRSAQEWSPVPSSERVPLEPGDRLRIGGRIISVELHHVR